MRARDESSGRKGMMYLLLVGVDVVCACLALKCRSSLLAAACVSAARVHSLSKSRNTSFTEGRRCVPCHATRAIVRCRVSVRRSSSRRCCLVGIVAAYVCTHSAERGTRRARETPAVQPSRGASERVHRSASKVPPICCVPAAMPPRVSCRRVRVRVAGVSCGAAAQCCAGLRQLSAGDTPHLSPSLLPSSDCNAPMSVSLSCVRCRVVSPRRSWCECRWSWTGSRRRRGGWSLVLASVGGGLAARVSRGVSTAAATKTTRGSHTLPHSDRGGHDVKEEERRGREGLGRTYLLLAHLSGIPIVRARSFPIRSVAVGPLRLPPAPACLSAI